MSASYLSFRDLQCIVAVAEQGTFSAAASACAITQPSLSERMKRIESILDVSLFERNQRRMKVTSVGEAVIRKARELLDGANEIDKIVSTRDEPLTGVLRVGFINTLGPYLVPHLLPRMRSQYPNLDLVLHEGLTESLLAELQAGSLDLVIAANPLQAEGIKLLKLFKEPFQLAIPKNHALAAQDTVNAADLNGADMILLEDGHCLSGQALDICPARRRTNKSRLHSSSLETLRQMVAVGAGYTLLPYLAIGKNPALKSLIRYRSLGGKQQYGRSIVLAARRSYSRDRDVSLFAELIRDCLPSGVRKIES